MYLSETMHVLQNLILSLIETGRTAADDELRQIVAHVVQAPFSTRLLTVNRQFRQDLADSGVQITATQLSSIEIHLLKRIYIEQQWPLATTITQYLADLHQAVQHPGCEIHTYRWRGESFLSFLAPSHVLHVPNPQPFLFVAYSADYGTIKTGYQVSSFSTLISHRFERLTRHR